MADILFCSAIAAESDLVADASRSGRIPARTIELGVGNITAAFALEDHLRGADFSEVIFLGSAGMYGEGPLPRGAYSSRFTKIESAVMQGHSSVPALLESRISCSPGRAATFLQNRLRYREGVVNCPDSISLQKAEPMDLDYENMECFGIAFVCRRHNIPFAAFLAVTNHVGPGGSAEWKETYKEKGAALQKEILSALEHFSPDKT